MSSEDPEALLESLLTAAFQAIHLEVSSLEFSSEEELSKLPKLDISIHGDSTRSRARAAAARSDGQRVARQATQQGASAAGRSTARKVGRAAGAPGPRMKRR